MSPQAPPPAPRTWILVPNLSAVVFWWQKWMRQGGGRGILTHACTEVYVRLSSPRARPRIACDRHQHQQCYAGAGAGRQRWQMRAWSRGCARTQARGRPAMCHACISEGVRVHFPAPSLHPLPAPDSLCPPCCLPLCLSPFAIHPLPLPVSPSASLSSTWCWQGAGKEAPARYQPPNKASVYLRHQYKSCASEQAANAIYEHSKASATVLANYHP